jgi:hypothetical protein
VRSTRKLVTKSECHSQIGNRDFGEAGHAEREIRLWKDGLMSGFPNVARENDSGVPTVFLLKSRTLMPFNLGKAGNSAVYFM